MPRILLESPVFNVETALKAEEFGVDRIELCSSFQEGGETPGAGMFRYLKSRMSIPIFVMIRPRGGDFVYSSDELNAMEEEIRLLSSLGADGFVFGVLNPDGTVNTRACRKLVNTAGSKPCTFHRAIDVSRNPEESLEAIIDCGFRRVLTSGGQNSVEEGLEIIKRMFRIAGERIIIMPGGGMKPELAEPLKETGFLKEVHASCKTREPVNHPYTHKYVSLNTTDDQNQGRLTISRENVNRFKEVL